MLTDAAALIETYGATAFAVAALAFFAGGFAKGATGFGLPLVTVAGATLTLPPEIAVPMIAVPGFFTNIWQSLRMGWRAALATLKDFRVLYATLFIAVLLTTQVAAGLDERTFFLILGVGVAGLSLLQLWGWRPSVNPEHRTRTEAAAGVIGGVFGGLTAVWGPVIVMIMLALKLPKQEHVRACGIGMGLGALPFMIGHASTGLLSGGLFVLSTVALIPAFAGMRIGMMLQDRLDPETFRRWTLIICVVAGANLIRRAVFG